MRYNEKILFLIFMNIYIKFYLQQIIIFVWKTLSYFLEYILQMNVILTTSDELSARFMFFFFHLTAVHI